MLVAILLSFSPPLDDRTWILSVSDVADEFTVERRMEADAGVATFSQPTRRSGSRKRLLRWCGPQVKFVTFLPLSIRGFFKPILQMCSERMALFSTVYFSSDPFYLIMYSWTDWGSFFKRVSLLEQVKNLEAFYRTSFCLSVSYTCLFIAAVFFFNVFFFSNDKADFKSKGMIEAFIFHVNILQSCK